jgi:Response regulator containing CheY-like receiver domain and AraC-type DNA-binding domain
MIIRGRLAGGAEDQWNIIEAEGAQEVLAMEDLPSIDLITIDVNMPGMDGLTLAGKIRERLPEAHIAIITANAQEALKARAEAIGATFFTKPLNDDKVTRILALAGS